MENTEQPTLPSGSRIGVYEIRGAVASSDFSIVYRGLNHHLNAKVSIEEYFPRQFAKRTADAHAVEPLSNETQEDFDAGLSSFTERSEGLLNIDHPNIVTILNALEANGTAYLVTNYTEELSLAKLFINRQAQFDEDELSVIFLPVLSALQQVHEYGVIHGAATPMNILLKKDAEPVLINFANARLALANRTDTLSDFISAEYAPPEYGATRDELGPWSDIYTLGATMYHCVSGRAPSPACDRIAALSRNDPDSLQPLTRMQPVEYSEAMCATIDSMLALKTSDRPQSADAVLTLLAQAPDNASADSTRALDAIPGLPATEGNNNKRLIMGAGAVLTAAGFIVLGFWLQKPEERNPNSLTADELRQKDTAQEQVQTALKTDSHETEERLETPADERLAFAKPKAQTDYPLAENAQTASVEATGAVPPQDATPPDTEQEPKRAISDISETASLGANEIATGAIQKDITAAPDNTTAAAESTELSLPGEIRNDEPEVREDSPDLPEPVLTQPGQDGNKNTDPDTDRSAAATYDATTADKRSGALSPVGEPVEPPPSLPAIGAERNSPKTVSLEVARPQTTDDSAGMSDTDHASIIAEHIAAAEEHLDAKRLTTPADRNAYAHYRAILEIAPNHPDGRMGLESILSHYGGLIEKAVNEGRLKNAWIYLSRARSVLPDAPALDDFLIKIEEAEAVGYNDYEPVRE